MDWSKLSVWKDVVSRNAAAFPDKAALVGKGRSVSFGRFKDRVNRLNNALHELGLAKGDRVAILTRNRPEFIEAYGVAQSGMIAVPLNWRLSPRELLHPLKDSRPAAVLAEGEFASTIDLLRGEIGGLRHFLSFDAAGTGWLGYEALLAGASPDEPRVQVAPEDILCVMYTSGTTGTPKGAMLTHGALLRNCQAAAEHLLGLTPDDVTLAVMPLFHVGGMWYHLFPSFALGCTSVILNGFEPTTVLEALRAYRVTNVHLVPTMVHSLLEHGGPKDLELDHLRLVYYAASSMPVEVLRQALAVFSRSAFVQSYGSTEAGIITCLTPDDHLQAIRDPNRVGLLASCGRPLGAVEVGVLDSAGRELPPGEVGEIVVRGDRTMAGYWRSEASVRRGSARGWFATGDMGLIDEARYVTIVDRKHDMIVSGGENIYPWEVEEILRRDPEVLEAAVFGMPDTKWVEKVAAAVVLRPGSSSTAEDIIRRAHGQLAGYKCPKTVIFAESLPRTATGKVLKKELRRLYAA